MTSTSLTFIAKGLYSLLLILACQAVLSAADYSTGSQTGSVNYSRWPKRSPLWSKAADLLNQGKADDAQALLEKEAAINPLTPECEKMLNELRFRGILSPHSPDKEPYVVKRGDTLFNIARKTKSSADYIMAVNNMTDRERLSIGDTLQVRALDMKLVVDVKKKSISLIDKESVLKTYPVLALRTPNVGTIKTSIRNETGSYGNGVVSANSEYFPSADKTIHLRNGMIIGGTTNATAPSEGFFVSPEDCNELSLLVIAGNEVEIIH